jgi:hypothetical protein
MQKLKEEMHWRTPPRRNKEKKRRSFISVTKMLQVEVSSRTVDKQQIGRESFSFEISFF